MGVQTGVMKFYYCETCGKRVTDEELASGRARDKQVKGIFCQDCKDGVSTISFTPMKESELRPAEADEPILARPRTSPHEMAAPRSRSGIASATSATRKEQNERRPAKGMLPVIKAGMAIAAGIVVLAV